jgi:uncharacterized protein
VVFEVGTNQWRTFSQWPPDGARPRALYFMPGGILELGSSPARAAGQLQESNHPASGDCRGGFVEWVSDPARPVPYTNDLCIGMTREHMTDDQRPWARRPDVAVHHSTVLDEDLTVVGPIRVSIVISSTGTDSDFIVKLIDCHSDDHPNPTPAETAAAADGDTTAAWNTATRVPVEMAGYQQLVRGEPFRAKFRNSFETPEALTPGTPTLLEFTMPDICHTFRRGHRLAVHVQSSWFPLVRRHPSCKIHIVYIFIYNIYGASYREDGGEPPCTAYSACHRITSECA